VLGSSDKLKVKLLEPPICLNSLFEVGLKCVYGAQVEVMIIPVFEIPRFIQNRF